MTVASGSDMIAMAGIVLLAATACAGPLSSSSEPEVDGGATSRALRKLPRPEGEKVPVAIHQFTTESPDINPRLATDMFTTALVKSGQFAVLERARLSQGVAKERQLAAAGETSGAATPGSTRPARYVFEAVLSEVNPAVQTGKGNVTVAGAQLARITNDDVIGIDVRIIDVDTSEVLDSVSVRKAIRASSHEASGLGALAGNLLGGRAGAAERKLAPDAALEGSRKESVDQALRSCIEAAVLDVSKRFQH